MAIVTIGNVDVVVMTRDEHCPPHVHADCSPEGWSARYKFFYTSDDLEFWDFKPDNPKRAPSKSRLDEIGMAIFPHLSKVRKRWWEVLGRVCLDNQYVIQTADGIEVIYDKRRRKGVPQVQSATYDPLMRLVTLNLTNGSTIKFVL